MKPLKRFFKRLGSFATRQRDEERLREEIEEHIAFQTNENIRVGMSPAEARRQAKLKFGAMEAMKENYRAERGLPFIETLWRDVRYGVGMLRKSPVFAAAAILTLALGIGANTAIFSLIDAVMLRSLPVRSPSQLMLLNWSARHAPDTDSYWSSGDCADNVGFGANVSSNPSGCTFSEPFFRRIAMTNAFSGAAAFATCGQLDLTSNGRASLVNCQFVSGDFFRTMGVAASLGRVLDASDDSPSATPVVVLSYGYWQSAFGGSRSVIGRTVELNKVAFTVSGVASARFTGITPGSDYDVWLPLSAGQRITDARLWTNRQDDARYWWLTIIGRLRPEMQPAQTRAEVSSIFRDEMLHGPKKLSTPADNPEITLLPAQSGLTGTRTRFYDPLYMLMLAVGIILLIACANVAGLMLARASTRRKELTVRLTLGAGRLRIVRQLLTESVMLSIVGGTLGVLFAYWAAHAIVSFVSKNQVRPLAFAIGIDTRVLGFTIAVSLLAGILFGIAPAFRGIRIDLTPSLKEGAGVSTGSGDVGRRWFSIGNGLVVAQVALAVVVLVGAGLLVRTLQNLRNVDLGFDPRNIVTFSVNPTLAGYKDARIASLYRDLQGRLAAMPGVTSVSYSLGPLVSGGQVAIGFHWPGTPQEQVSEADYLQVGPNFFETMHVSFVGGRDFTPSDFELAAANRQETPTTAPTPAIVNQAFVQEYMGKENPLGKQFGESPADADGPANPGCEIIGVVRNTRGNPRRRIRAMMYAPQSGGRAWFELRAATGPRSILPAIRTVVADVNPDLPLFDVSTESQQIDRLLFEERLIARFSSLFGALALLLACIGLYGLLSYEVSGRTREIGIRIALGAKSGGLLRFVVGRGLLLALTGAAIGISTAVGLTRFMASMLYGIRATDPLTMIAVTVLLMLVALAACYVPARRAMRVDPMVALRYE